MSLIDFGLTEHEGVLLALVARAGPITAYQITKVYEESPVSNYNSSKGKIYPMVRRLRAAGLLTSEAVAGDGRGTEHLSITQSGIEAVRQWVLRISESQLLTDDPLRTRLQSMDLLTLDERLQWVSALREELRAKLRVLEQYGQEVSTPFHELVHDNAVRSIQSRMDWLDRVLASMLREEERASAC